MYKERKFLKEFFSASEFLPKKTLFNGLFPIAGHME